MTPLARHPNDPGPHRSVPQVAANAPELEFFTTLSLTIPPGEPTQLVEDRRAGEARRTAELAAQGHLRRLWTLPAPGRSLGLWRAADRPEMEGILASLPLAEWLTVDTVPLARHPNDPLS